MVVRVRSPHVVCRRVPLSSPDAFARSPCCDTMEHACRSSGEVCNKKSADRPSPGQRGKGPHALQREVLRLGIAQTHMNRAHNRERREQCQVNFRGVRIASRVVKKCQRNRSLEHGTVNQTIWHHARHVSTTLRHTKEHWLPAPGNEFSPRARGMFAARTAARHYVTIAPL